MDSKRKIAVCKFNKSTKRKIISKRYYEKYKNKIYKYQKEWVSKNRDKLNAWSRKHNLSPSIKIKRKIYRNKWRAKNKKKIRAIEKVNNAIRDGRLIKYPCSICNNPKSQGHHPNYNEPLKVIWLCKKHHTEIHHNFPI